MHYSTHHNSRSHRIRSNNERGAAMMISVIFFIVASVLVVLGLTGPAAREFRLANDAISSRQSYFMGESGAEDAYYRLKNGMHVDSGSTIYIGSGSVTTTVADIGSEQKEIVGTGAYRTGRRVVTLTVTTGTDAVFSSGVLALEHGLALTGASGVTGDVYSDGPITGEDASFISGMATSSGASGLISGVDASHTLHIGTGGTANAHAHDINYASVTGTMYCAATISSSGSCTSEADPASVVLPIGSPAITQWQIDAESGGVITGDYLVGSSGATIGPKKIIGDVALSDGGILTVSGTLWITGNLIVEDGGEINLASAYGANAGVVVVDGTITIATSGAATGSGTAGSYLLLLSKHTTVTSESAIDVSSGAGSVILYAADGIVSVSSGAAAKEAVGGQVVLSGGATVDYEPGLLHVNFLSGSIDPFSVHSWKETN